MPTASFTFNLSGPQPRNPVSIFHLGQAFYLAGSRCLLNIEVGPGMMQSLVSPGVVNLCLAIELFLKSIIAAAGDKVEKTHKLLDLFSAVPKTDLDAIKAAYEPVLQNPSFDELLAQINNYFVEVRYGHEFNIFSFNEFPVSRLAKIVYIHAAAVHKAKTQVEEVRA